MKREEVGAHQEDDNDEESDNTGEPLYEADVYPRQGSRALREYKTSIDDYFMDPSWQMLDTQNMAILYDRFSQDANIRTVTHIYQSMLFAGNVIFERPDAEMTPDAKRWFNSVWSAWGSDVDSAISILGWAACTFVPDDTYIASPVVIDVLACTILYKRDFMGRPHYVFFENISGGLQSGSGLLSTQGASIKSTYGCCYRYIPNVVVYVETPPTHEGVIRSKVAVLAPDLDMDDLLAEATKVASVGRAQPPLIIEAVKPQHDAEAVIQNITPLSMFMGNGATPDTTSSTANKDVNYSKRARQEEYEKQMYQYSRSVALSGPGGIEDAYRKHDERTRPQIHSEREYFIGEGRHYVSHTLPESPGDVFLNFRVARAERVFNIFGIPLGLISQQSSIGGHTSMNENASVVFANTQKQRKEMLQDYMYDAYERIYAPHHTIQRLLNSSNRAPESYASNSRTGKSTQERISNDTKKRQLEDGDYSVSLSTGVTIVLSGLPEDQVLLNLFTMGALTFEALKKFMSARYSIPACDFETECVLSREELAGVKPDATEAGPAKKKTKTKK